jgi:hypothetical protein
VNEKQFPDYKGAPRAAYAAKDSKARRTFWCFCQPLFVIIFSLVAKYKTDHPNVG